MRHQVITISLCEKQVIVNPTAFVWTTIVTTKVLEWVGPYVDDISAELRLDQVGVTYQVRVRGQLSNDLVNWTDFSADILPGAMASGNRVSAAYTTRTDFGLHLRFLLEVYADTATESAVVSGKVHVKLC